jgi:glutamine amidotransferase
VEVAIIKYNSGNVRSVAFAIERLGVIPVITNDPGQIQAADHVIFPGVGEAGSAMRYLKEHNLDKVIKTLKQPVLGICLGMQLLCRNSEEGDTTCLGIFDQEVKQFETNLKVPQIGWNTVKGLTSPLFNGIPEESYMYFVHGFYTPKSTSTIGVTGYGLDYSSALRRDNFYAVQFHPERSAALGQKLLSNFLSIS